MPNRRLFRSPSSSRRTECRQYSHILSRTRLDTRPPYRTVHPRCTAFMEQRWRLLHTMPAILRLAVNPHFYYAARLLRNVPLGKNGMKQTRAAATPGSWGLRFCRAKLMSMFSENTSPGFLPVNEAPDYKGCGAKSYTVR